MKPETIKLNKSLDQVKSCEQAGKMCCFGLDRSPKQHIGLFFLFFSTLAEKRSAGPCDDVSVHGSVNLLRVVNDTGSVLRCLQQQLIHHSLSVVARSGHPVHTNPLYARQCVAALRWNPALHTSGSRLYFKPASEKREREREKWPIWKRQQRRCCRSSKHTILSQKWSCSEFMFAPISHQSTHNKSSQREN